AFGDLHIGRDGGDGVHVETGRPADRGDRRERLDGEGGSGEHEQRVRTRCLDLGQLRGHARRGDVVALFVNDQRGARAEPVGQAFQIVLAVVVVLVQHTDLGVFVVGEYVLGVDVRLTLVGWLPA